ncbi:MAG: hypothetical protein EBU18_13495, partial [Rhodobacteraceae bacterium]|nr:hypothetical protein [Paracoccaceae bacterium]
LISPNGSNKNAPVVGAFACGMHLLYHFAKQFRHFVIETLIFGGFCAKCTSKVPPKRKEPKGFSAR